jgi:hypothetical protein
VVLVDPRAQRLVVAEEMATTGRNSPFRGRRLPGRVVATFLHGHPTVLDGAPASPRSEDVPAEGPWQGPSQGLSQGSEGGTGAARSARAAAAGPRLRAGAPA